MRITEGQLRRIIREALLREVTMSEQLPLDHWAQWVNMLNPMDAYENYLDPKNLAIQKETDLTLAAMQAWVDKLAYGAGSAAIVGAGVAGYTGSAALGGSINIAARIVVIPSAALHMTKMIFSIAKGEYGEAGKSAVMIALLSLLGEKGDDGIIMIVQAAKRIPISAAMRALIISTAQRVPSNMTKAIEAAGIMLSVELLLTLLTACSNGMFSLAAEIDTSECKVDADEIKQAAQNLETAANLLISEQQSDNDAPPGKSLAPPAPEAPAEERKPFVADWEKQGWSADDLFPKNLQEHRWLQLAGLLVD